MNIHYIYPSEVELDEAVTYYNYELQGLGDEFYKEVKNAIVRIGRFPKAWTRIGIHTRRCLLRKFPYAILYSIDVNEDILILAIANLHRDPICYKDRLF